MKSQSRASAMNLKVREKRPGRTSWRGKMIIAMSK
jgi:hypothetical protein